MKYKFRALSLENEWVYGSLLHDLGSDTYYIVTKMYELSESHLDCQFGVEAYEVIPESIGQFTGLKDRNGVEIYDGDIVFVKHGSINWIRALIEWNDVIMAFRLIYLEEFKQTSMNKVIQNSVPSVEIGEWDMIPKNAMDTKIIGDKFNNPELVEGI